MKAEDCKVGMRVRVTVDERDGRVGTVGVLENMDNPVSVRFDDGHGQLYWYSEVDPVEQHKEPAYRPDERGVEFDEMGFVRIWADREDLSELDEHLESFIDGMRERHYSNKPERGDGALHKAVVSSLTDMREELLDLANYAAYTAAKLERMRAQITDVEHDLTSAGGKLLAAGMAVTGELPWTEIDAED